MADDRSQVSVNDEYIEKYGFHEEENNFFKSRKGLDEEIVRQISAMKNEPEWMTDFRLRSLAAFNAKPMPNWGSEALRELNFDDIFYYIKPTEGQSDSWDDLPSEIKNTYDRLGIPEAEKKYLAGVGAQYECLHEDTRVFTKRGPVPIREVVVGDVIFSLDESRDKLIPAPVKGTAYKGEKQVFEVRVGTRTIRATDNHPFLALTYRREPGRQRGRYQREWKYLRDLSVGDLVAVSKQLPDVGQPVALSKPILKSVTTGRNQFGAEYTLDISERYRDVTLPTLTSVDLMWWFGLYIGDGFIHRSKGQVKARVEFAIPVKDKELRAELSRVTESEFNVPMTQPDDVRLAVNATALARFIESNGFDGTARTKRVPRWVFELPEDRRLAFLGGFIDADGYVRDSSRNHDISVTSANAELLSDIRKLALTCGIATSSIARFESKHPTDGNRALVGYRMQFSGDFNRVTCRSPQRTSRLGKRAYAHGFTSAHSTSFKSHANEHLGFARIDSIVPAGVARVFDIEVDGPHNFVAEGLIVHNSEVIYHSLAKDLEDKGVIFLDTDTALKQQPELFRQYFGTIIPYSDNKFAALNSAVWSGGSFIYVPPGVKIDMPLQAYFRINAKNVGQFERTLIIVDEGAQVHYVEGCTAPVYSSDSLHSAVVEIIVKKGGRCRYTTIQNWSTNVYNLVTKRAAAYEDATMEWVDGNLGCLAEGSTVTTPQGVRPIESIEVGDEVLSYDESAGQLCFRRVAAKRFSGYQPVHTVSLGERKLHVTANHPFYSYAYDADAPKKRGRYRLAYVRADQLKEAIVPRGSIDYGQPHRLVMPALTTTFDTANQYASHLTASRERDSRLATMEYTTDDIMWLFGYWIGDGNIDIKEAQTKNVIRWAKVGFSTPSTDRARERLVETMAAVIEAEPTERSDGHHLSWNSKELAEFLHANGFSGKANSKRTPDWVRSLPESQRLAFIAGYLDADGYVRQPRSFVLKSVNRALLEDVAALLVTLGITPNLYTEFTEPRRVIIQGVECIAHGAYRLEFALDERLVSQVSPQLREIATGAPPAKLQHRRRVGRSNLTLSGSVEIAGVEVSEALAAAVPTWDIEVEGTGNFVSQGFIVHNSKLTMKYPAVYLMEPGAHGEILSIAFAGKGQHQDAGGKVVHAAPHTTSKIVSKSISKDGGRTSYRGLLKVYKDATDSKSNVVCDALLLDEHSRSDTYPYIEVDNDEVNIGHEASVSKIGEEQLFYAMSRGVSEEDASTMVVSGFIEPLVKELPMEYAVEMNRLIALQMEGTVG